MRSYVAIGFAVIGLLAARPADSFAQDSVLAELYGHGVHAYFAGNYQDAHTYLTTAIDQGTRDPRTFYFRGLAYTALGRPDEAKTDFQKGAELETTGADRVYPVSTSLQRVQGTSRIEIERQRQLARLAARTRTVRASQARYEQLQNAEGQVLRNPSRPQPASAKELVGTPPAQDTSDPFGGDAQPVEPEPAQKRRQPSQPITAPTSSVTATRPMRCRRTRAMHLVLMRVRIRLLMMPHRRPRVLPRPMLQRLIHSPIPLVNPVIQAATD